MAARARRFPVPFAPARRSLAAGTVATALVLMGPAPAAPAQDDGPGPRPEKTAPPRSVVERLHETLLAAMRSAGELGYEGRRARIGPVLEDSFDFPFMAEKAAGRFWRDLDAAQRERLVDAFSRLAVATYAARFSGWDGERFETLGQEEATHGTVLVKTRIVPGNGEAVPLDYRLHEPEAGRWRIVDVFLNGTVSELALRRSEYSGIIKREGFDALLETLERKIADQARDGAA